MAAAEPGRFFCTAGRGMEPFVEREVRARLGATEVSGELGPGPAGQRRPPERGAGAGAGARAHPGAPVLSG